jgi:hypothetical protein
MKIKMILIPILLIGEMILSGLYSQVVIQPNTGLKTPQTLIIDKIDNNQEKCIIWLTIENKISGGYFCADKNISIIYHDGSKARLVSAAGIPQCPDTYKFKMAGEKLQFTLVFPPLKENTKWFDIVEECSDNCFYIYGVTLDSSLNEKLDEAFETASKQAPEKNIELFRNLLARFENQNHGIIGLIYVNIITAAVEAGDRVEASVWYKRLLESKAPEKMNYVKYLNDQGIRF